MSDLVFGFREISSWISQEETRAKRRKPNVSAVLLSAAIIWLIVPHRAEAVPSFAVQTGQPCAACHVGSFGPQLTQFGRDFKLFGYTASEGKGHFPPIAITGQASFTKTEKEQQPPPRWYNSNDNIALDQEVAVYYAGRITSELGAFAQVKFDGTARNVSWDNSDVRYAHDSQLFRKDFVYGVTVNNGASNQDIWNSSPTWGFPYVASRLATSPAASTKIDGNLTQNVLGAGAFASWNSLLFLEFDLYKGLDQDARKYVGNVPVYNTDQVTGTTPYWRAALEHSWNKGEHYVELGTYGLTTHIAPQNMKSTFGTDYYIDNALDANYQWFSNPKNVTSDYLSAHTTYIRERQQLNATSLITGSNDTNTLDTFRADVSYSIGATYTPTIQYFRMRGSQDAALYSSNANGSPNSEGVRFEMAYVPWGKPGDGNWYNTRVSVQYIDYMKFDGTSASAHDNNTIYLNVTWALGLNHFY